MVSDKKIRFAKDSKEVANKLLDIGCVQFNVNNPYTWVSGIRSPIYCDNRKITSYIKSRGVVLNSFVALIGEEFPNCDIVAGV
ncbi:MAG: orotate phosphoribosyltransferase, partial [Marinirhabdus sp.]